jgi:hypothetical protein
MNPNNPGFRLIVDILAIASSFFTVIGFFTMLALQSDDARARIIVKYSTGIFDQLLKLAKTVFYFSLTAAILLVIYLNLPFQVKQAPLPAAESLNRGTQTSVPVATLTVTPTTVSIAAPTAVPTATPTATLTAAPTSILPPTQAPTITATSSPWPTATVMTAPSPTATATARVSPTSVATLPPLTSGLENYLSLSLPTDEDIDLLNSKQQSSSIWKIATRIEDGNTGFLAKTMPGKYEYVAVVSPKDRKVFGFVWTEIDNKTLDTVLYDDLGDLKLLVNNVQVVNEIRKQRPAELGIPQFLYSTLLSNWKPGAVITLEMTFTVKKTFYATVDRLTYNKGVYRFIITVQVQGP